MSPSPRARAPVKPRKSPLQERSRDTLKAILEGAAQVLEREGYAGATTDRIAERAGVSVGSVYQYFPNKDAILLALTQCHVLETWLAVAPQLDALADAPALEPVLRRITRALVVVHAARPGLHRVLFEETPIPADLRAVAAGAERALAARLAEWLTRLPEVRVERPRLAAHLVLHTLLDAIHRFVIAPPRGFDVDACEEELVRLLLRYLTTEPRSAAT